MNDNNIKCPKCKETIEQGSVFCPHCGEELNLAAIPAAGNEKENLQEEVKFTLLKSKIIHTLVTTIDFTGTKVTVNQKHKWLGLFPTTVGNAEFDVNDIQAAYIKKSYSTMFVILLILLLIPTILEPNILFVAICVIVGSALRDTALIIKYKNGSLKLVDDKNPFIFDKHDDPQLVLDHIKKYNPECVQIMLD